MSGQAAFARALLDPAQPCPEGLSAWHGAGVNLRFAVYRNNVAVSLVEALADTFEVTQQLVGEDFFRAMALVYVREQPPRTAVLALYGESFPAFIGRFPPAASVPYLSAVAHLEWLRARAFHAAEPSADPVSTLSAALAHIQVLPNRQVGLHPSLGLVQSEHAVVSLWAAHQGIRDISTVDPDVPENALIIRPELEVEVSSINAEAALFIAQLLQGRTLGQAAARTATAYPQFDLTTMLAGLIRRRVILSLE